MKDSSVKFCRNKWVFVIRLLAGGLGLALVWALWAQFVLHQGYPQSCVLGLPAGRYADFTDETLAAALPNPYADPISVYPPAAFLLFRVFSISDNTSLILVFFFSLTALALLLTRLLLPIIPNAWTRVSFAFLFLALSYPLLFCIDRGNIEIIMAPLIGWSLYFYSRHRDIAGTACLFPAICFKFYPALLLILLLRRRKAGLALACGIAALVAIVASAAFFPTPLRVLWTCYRHNLDFFRDCYILDNPAIYGSASLWNAYKIVLIALQDAGIIPIIDFGFDGPFILASYHVYSALFMLFTLVCAAYAWLHERQQSRGILVLLLFTSIAAPNGADYRLLYASMALALLALIPKRRRGDWLALALIAIAVIPKKEILLDFVGKTETRFADVPIQALLNPVCIFFAMAILISQSGPFDRPHAVRWLRDLLPSRWRWA